MPVSGTTLFIVYVVTTVSIQLVASSRKYRLNDVFLKFFSKYPAMGVHPLLLECHGSVMTPDRRRSAHSAQKSKVANCI